MYLLSTWIPTGVLLKWLGLRLGLPVGHIDTHRGLTQVVRVRVRFRFRFRFN